MLRRALGMFWHFLDHGWIGGIFTRSTGALVMMSTHSEPSDPHDTAQSKIRSYINGFSLSRMLPVAACSAGLSSLTFEHRIWIIGFTGPAQVSTHLRFSRILNE